MCYDLRRRFGSFEFPFLELKKDTQGYSSRSRLALSKVESQNSLPTERKNSSRVGKNLSGINEHYAEKHINCANNCTFIFPLFHFDGCVLEIQTKVYYFSVDSYTISKGS